MIDVKEIRIGSHLQVDGCICEVYGTSSKGLTIRFGERPNLVFPSGKKDVQPIPITEDLLQEMGFEHLWEKDTWYWRKDFDDDQYVIIVIYDGYVRVKIHTKGDCPYNIFRCEYLHELETFVYLTLREELIKD